MDTSTTKERWIEEKIHEYIHKRSLKMANVHPTTSILWIIAKFSLSKLFLKIITLNIGKISIERNSTQVMFITIKTCGDERSVQKTGDGLGARQKVMLNMVLGLKTANPGRSTLCTRTFQFSLLNLSFLYIIKNNVKQGMAVAYG
ncbi:hypothetical protein T12_2989 [Trichinella patagoniensis]|uniref:Uncharacterized protein n=1 Tax=Trichinella patagoniensis TaxID=990121 RepID=A0A0V0ZN54_9BILA|nr:hypothetical protein T12_2989 [Trichinella patagoniensis]